jgi:formate hydrogenlyase subunit 3/multisubunit Na+/H+ antiporter MnhD subunit
LLTLGFLSAFYGVAVGLTQRNPKVILAYSSISQMGVITATLGAALVNEQSETSLGVAFYAANHQLVKAALFLTIGCWAVRRLNHPQITLVLAALLALSLAGLPPTGGALAKLATKAQFTPGLETMLSALSSAATGLLMTHFMLRLPASPGAAAQQCPASVIRFWPAIAVGAILLPWVIYPGFRPILSAFAFRSVVDGLWPTALGVAVAFAAQRIRSWPRVPVGDSIVVAEAAFRRVLSSGPSLETFDRRLRQWPAAGISFASILLALLVAAMSGG